MNIFGIEIPRDILVTAILAVGLTILMVSWLYEHDMSVLRKKHALLEDALLDRTYDWLSARAEARSWQAEAFSFSDALQRHVERKGQGEAALWVAENLHEPSFSEHLATLFDQELMQGNND